MRIKLTWDSKDRSAMAVFFIKKKKGYYVEKEKRKKF